MRTEALTIAAVCIAMLAAVSGKAGTRLFATAWYKSTLNPGACIISSLPDGCSPFPSGTFCTIPDPFGGTRTYYGNASCTVPYYKQQ